MKNSHIGDIPLLLIIVCLVGIIGCDKTDMPKPIPIPEPIAKPIITPVFIPYFNTFLEEGKKRGVNFTAEEQEITIKLSNRPSKSGYGGWADYALRTIEIDSNWLRSNESYKEFLMFHELGHLLLKRAEHNIVKLPNGEYSSLMYTSDDNSDKCTRPLFTGNMRKAYYLDELFKPNTPVPTWATDNVTWKEPTQNIQTIVVGKNSWNKNAPLEALVTISPEQVSYKISSMGMNLVVGKTQTVNSEFKLPLNTLFPNLAETPLQNYEVRLRYKLYGRGFELGWAPNNAENPHSLISNNCGGENNYFGVSNNRGGFFVNKTVLQNLRDTNDLVLQQKDNYIMIWLNGRLIFQSDITAGTTASPLGMSLYFGASQYDFEFITVTKL